MTKIRSIMVVAFILSLSIACHSADKTPLISQEELVARISSNSAPTIIDVRTAEEYSAGHVPGAINVPLNVFDKQLEQLNLRPTDEIVVYCESGRRAGKAEKILQSKGYFEVRHLDGDMGKWREDKLPCEGCQ